MNCKPGDLAIMTRVLKPEMAQNIGQIVEVVRSGYLDRDYGYLWVVKATGLARWHDGFTDEVRTAVRAEGLYPDAWLQLISGVPIHDEQHTEEPITT